MAGASIQDECSGRIRQDKDQEWQEAGIQDECSGRNRQDRDQERQEPAFRMNVQEGIARIRIRSGRSQHSG
ncbi:hypothetical Protein YC6258_00914 [Gynuella sunshinyii YC6258]|uniref:Uncharacterized protein n=1 Tax=Gynuella sunshinyii YC6258 TaxID=1445510 RepID=A0A0C5VRR8_9GAMM|nr:hypothetical Protein YC6258_00914 [Gynuella sunshinyii YC6258]